MYGAVSPAALVVLGVAFLSRRRRKRGVKACEKFVSDLHEELGSEFEGPVVPLRVTAEQSSTEGLRDARKLLEAACRNCGGCRFGRASGIMQLSPPFS